MGIPRHKLEAVLALPRDAVVSALIELIERDREHSPRRTKGPLGQAHASCVRHEPVPDGITFLATRWLCFPRKPGDRRPVTDREVAQRITFVRELQRLVDRRRKAQPRLAGDGLLLATDGTRVPPIVPRADWAEQRAEYVRQTKALKVYARWRRSKAGAIPSPDPAISGHANAHWRWVTGCDECAKARRPHDRAIERRQAKLVALGLPVVAQYAPWEAEADIRRVEGALRRVPASPPEPARHVHELPHSELHRHTRGCWALVKAARDDEGPATGIVVYMGHFDRKRIVPAGTDGAFRVCRTTGGPHPVDRRRAKRKG